MAVFHSPSERWLCPVQTFVRRFGLSHELLLRPISRETQKARDEQVFEDHHSNDYSIHSCGHWRFDEKFDVPQFAHAKARE